VFILLAALRHKVLRRSPFHLLGLAVFLDTAVPEPTLGILYPLPTPPVSLLPGFLTSDPRLAEADADADDDDDMPLPLIDGRLPAGVGDSTVKFGVPPTVGFKVEAGVVATRVLWFGTVPRIAAAAFSRVAFVDVPELLEDEVVFLLADKDATEVAVDFLAEVFFWAGGFR